MIRKIVLLPDIHYPKQNKPAVKAVFEFIKWFKPHTINLIGDALEMDAINQWKMSKGNKKHFQGKRLRDEYEGFDRDILTPLEKICQRSDRRRKPVEKIYMGGNHEVWADIYVSRETPIEGMIEPQIYLRLKERNWKWIPYIVKGKDGGFRRGMCQFGKLLVMHGNYINKYHAAKTADMYSKSIAYGHTHDVQLFTKPFSDDAGYHTAQSIGCLCNKAPEFMRGKTNDWVNGFGVLYVRDDGNFNLYVPIIINGKFTYAGKTFDGNV